MSSFDLIIRGGHNIDPKMIEDCLATHPAVELVAAIGQPDDDQIVDIYNILFNDLKLYLNTLGYYDFYVADKQLLLDTCHQALLENGIPPSQIVLDSMTHD